MDNDSPQFIARMCLERMKIDVNTIWGTIFGTFGSSSAICRNSSGQTIMSINLVDEFTVPLLFT